MGVESGIEQAANQVASREPDPAGWAEVDQSGIDEHLVSPNSPPVSRLLYSTARQSSPDWDIELPQTQARPDADLLLELELNPSDDEAGADAVDVVAAGEIENIHEAQGPSSKRRRANN